MLNKLGRLRESKYPIRARLAAKLGISDKTLYNHENGVGGTAGVMLREQLAKALGVSVDEIFDKSGRAR